MKDDPDELLKTKGKFRTENADPDEYMKIKELFRYLANADELLKANLVIPKFKVKRLPNSPIPDVKLQHYARAGIRWMRVDFRRW